MSSGHIVVLLAVWTETEFTGKSKAVMLKLTILSSPSIRIMLLLGFVVELVRFILIPSMNHKYFVSMHNTMYDCSDQDCSNRPDFVLVELVFRMFVGIAFINNIVLLSSILSDQPHSETSLVNITKTVNPAIFVLLLFALAMDLRVHDDEDWRAQYKVVNAVWISLHSIGTVVVLKVLCRPLYTLNHLSLVIIHQKCTRKLCFTDYLAFDKMCSRLQA